MYYMQAFNSHIPVCHMYGGAYEPLIATQHLTRCNCSFRYGSSST
jgi:hypothetical protein